MGAIRQGLANLDALSWQGRLALFAVMLALAAAAWYVLLMAPLERHRRNLHGEALHRQNQIAALERRAPARRPPAPPPRATGRRARIAALKFDIDKLDKRIERLRRRMIGPGRMMKVLQGILSRDTGLRLISIENLAPKPLVGGGAKASAGAGAHHVFMHGVRIRFRGGYLQTLRYVKALEALPWHFVWGDMEYDVKDYPEAVGTLVVYTLSTEAAWI